MCHLSLPRSAPFYFFIIVPDKLTGLPVLSAAWIIINMRSEMSMGVHVKCVPWFHEANKSTDIKEMKRVSVWVFTKRLSSGEVTVTPYPDPYSWWLSLYAMKAYRIIPNCLTHCVTLEPLPVHREDLCLSSFHRLYDSFNFPLLDCGFITLQLGHKHNYPVHIHFHDFIFNIFYFVCYALL